MAFQITGRIDKIFPTVSFNSKDGSKTYYKRELVLDATRYDSYTGQRNNFENFPIFEFNGDRCSELDNYQAGDLVTVSFDLQGTKYPNFETGEIKYFTKAKGYKIESGVRNVNSLQRAEQPTKAERVEQQWKPQQVQFEQAQQPMQHEPKNDLPF